MRAHHIWFGISYSLAAVAGGLIGAAIQEERAYKKYEDALASHKRALDLAQTMKSERPVPEEGDLLVVTGDIETAPEDGTMMMSSVQHFDGTIKSERPADNPYHKAVEASATPHQLFVEGGINDYGISYIEEEEYHDEEDGRFKGQIVMVWQEHDPRFFMDGVQINDWDTRLGDSIVVDFTRLVPAGANQVLYVRNHKTDEDYEVIREIP